MIKNIERPISGHIAYSIVEHRGKFFEISTINLPLREMESYMTQWRDDWWQPPYPNETMVWECKESGERFGKILHCQGYRKPSSAIRKHHQLCHQIELKGALALNGREHQTVSRDKDRTPIGLVKDIGRRLRGLAR